MIIDIAGTCQYEGCEQLATVITCGRKGYNRPGHAEPACYCRTHAGEVEDEGSPEYVETCPNCGCRFGVN